MTFHQRRQMVLYRRESKLIGDRACCTQSALNSLLFRSQPVAGESSKIGYLPGETALRSGPISTVGPISCRVARFSAAPQCTVGKAWGYMQLESAVHYRSDHPANIPAITDKWLSLAPTSTTTSPGLMSSLQFARVGLPIRMAVRVFRHS